MKKGPPQSPLYLRTMVVAANRRPALAAFFLSKASSIRAAPAHCQTLLGRGWIREPAFAFHRSPEESGRAQRLESGKS